MQPLRSSERETPFDGPTSAIWGLKRLLRMGRNVLLVGVAIVLFVEIVGEPVLRYEYRYYGSAKNPHVVSGTYLGLSGPREVRAGMHAPECPLILFLKPSPPLWRRAIAACLPAD